VILVSSTYSHISIPTINVTGEFWSGISSWKWSECSIDRFYWNYSILNNISRCLILNRNLLYINCRALSLRLINGILINILRSWLLIGDSVWSVKLSCVLNETKISVGVIITRTIGEGRWLHLNLLNLWKVV